MGGTSGRKQGKYVGILGIAFKQSSNNNGDEILKRKKRCTNIELMLSEKKYKKKRRLNKEKRSGPHQVTKRSHGNQKRGGTYYWIFSLLRKGFGEKKHDFSIAEGERG